MRTTVNIDDALLAEAKQIAARSHRPLGSLIDDALRHLLASADDARAADRVTLPTHGRGGLRSGVDLEDNEQLAQLLGDNDPRRAAS